jgi:hypothetical protein
MVIFVAACLISAVLYDSGVVYVDGLGEWSICMRI